MQSHELKLPAFNRRPGRASWLAFILLVTVSAPLAQQPSVQPPPQMDPSSRGGGSVPVGGGEPAADPATQRMITQRTRFLNEARQQQIVADTTKLLQLATELKEEVEKSNKDTLSVSVVKKAEEIEKLAKSVKDKMKTGTGTQ